jgi:hypothetical protein
VPVALSVALLVALLVLSAHDAPLLHW